MFIILISLKPMWDPKSHVEQVVNPQYGKQKKKETKFIYTNKPCPIMPDALLVWAKFDRIDLFEEGIPKHNAQNPEPYTDVWVPLPLMKE